MYTVVLKHCILPNTIIITTTATMMNAHPKMDSIP